MLELLEFAAIALMVSRWFEPIQWLKKKIGLYGITNEYLQWMLYVDCSKCVAFWGTVLYTHNLPKAALTAVLAYTLDYLISKIEESYER